MDIGVDGVDEMMRGTGRTGEGRRREVIFTQGKLSWFSAGRRDGLFVCACVRFPGPPCWEGGKRSSARNHLEVAPELTGHGVYGLPFPASWR